MVSVLDVAVVIPVRNEERNLPFCLKALGKRFREIVVVDSDSQDSTRKIAQAAGAKVLDFHWDGKFPKKRNWVLANHSFQSTWVLFLDADERITEAFLTELEDNLKNTEHAGFWISFENWFMGRSLNYGDTFRKLALFRVGAGEYEKFPEEQWSYLDMEVHEHPVLEGSLGEINSRIEHRDYRGLSHYISKHNEYSSWEARRYLWLQSANEEEWDKLNERQRFKYRHLNKWWLGRFYWLVSYLLKRGFLDGRAGWTFACFKQRYFEDIRLKVLEYGKGHE